jgi:hypothetical protein
MSTICNVRNVVRYCSTLVWVNVGYNVPSQDPSMNTSMARRCPKSRIECIIYFSLNTLLERPCGRWRDFGGFVVEAAEVS